MEQCAPQNMNANMHYRNETLKYLPEMLVSRTAHIDF